MTEAAMTIRLLRGRGKYVLHAGGMQIASLKTPATQEALTEFVTRALTKSAAGIAAPLAKEAH